VIADNDTSVELLVIYTRKYGYWTLAQVTSIIRFPVYSDLSLPYVREPDAKSFRVNALAATLVPYRRGGAGSGAWCLHCSITAKKVSQRPLGRKL
jgi:hypothetical protein